MINPDVDMKQVARIAIANDVLMQLEAERIIPWVGQYIQKDGCHVCALGAMFCAAASAASVDQIAGRNAAFQLQVIKDLLLPFFSEEQLGLIECAFETSNIYATDSTSYEFIDAAIDFGNRYEDSAACLEAIMQNIVQHGGEFQP